MYFSHLQRTDIDIFKLITTTDQKKKKKTKKCNLFSKLFWGLRLT